MNIIVFAVAVIFSLFSSLSSAAGYCYPPLLEEGPSNKYVVPDWDSVWTGSNEQIRYMLHSEFHFPNSYLMKGASPFVQYSFSSGTTGCLDPNYNNIGYSTLDLCMGGKSCATKGEKIDTRGGALIFDVWGGYTVNDGSNVIVWTDPGRSVSSISITAHDRIGGKWDAALFLYDITPLASGGNRNVVLWKQPIKSTVHTYTYTFPNTLIAQGIKRVALKSLRSDGNWWSGAETAIKKIELSVAVNPF
ncbi:hypothetical protein P886_1465 [Alteromonadaceae bacterium 2753L.S.0a.02]|nr:hypothetical protein P886_1465 [Alteromonadaceae bacterium 2753L.S.0a.02]